MNARTSTATVGREDAAAGNEQLHPGFSGERSDQRDAVAHLAATGALDPAWLTATVRPAGSFGREDVGRLRALLQALAACASIVVLDLQAVRLRSPRAAAAIDEAAAALEAHGGCLICLNADAEASAWLVGGRHAVVVASGDGPGTRS